MKLQKLLRLLLQEQSHPRANTYERVETVELSQTVNTYMQLFQVTKVEWLNREMQVASFEFLFSKFKLYYLPASSLVSGDEGGMVESWDAGR